MGILGRCAARRRLPGVYRALVLRGGILDGHHCRTDGVCFHTYWCQLDGPYFDYTNRRFGKITQLAYGVIAPGNITTNIATAGLSAEVAGSASNLIQNIKPGYMLGGKPRFQAIGHVIGAFSGAIFSVAVFYPLFLKNNPAGLISEQYPYPAATVWEAVARILTQGLHMLAESAVWAAAIGAVLGIVFEIIRQVSKNKFPLSAVGIGLAFIIPFQICLAMFMGSFVFWLISKIWPKAEQRPNEIFVQNQESICAGVIAGAALIGVAIMAVEVIAEEMGIQLF